MQNSFYDTGAPKKATNLSVNSDLLRMAREARINLSQVLENGITELLRDELRRKWREENRQAINDYNRRIKADSAFGDELRRF